MKTLLFNVNGTMYLSKKIIKVVAEDLKSGDILELEREPSNKHDPFAVKVFYDDQFIGYVERDTSEDVSKLIDSGVDYDCVVFDCFAEWDTRYTDSDREVEYVSSIELLVEITLK